MMEPHLQSLIAWLSAHPHIALAVVFAGAVLEAVILVGTVVPGSAIVFAGGVLVGLQVLDPWWTAALAIAGAVLGDGISYSLGRRYHERIRAMWPLSRFPGLLHRGQAYFENHGGKSVFLGRFLSPVRAIVPMIAGMSDMPPARFYAMNVLSAFAWSAAHLLPGALFGASIQLAGAVSSRLAIAIVALVIFCWVFAKLVRWLLSRGWPHVASLRDRVVQIARRGSGMPSRVVLSLFDPARPESPALLTAAVLLIGGGWLFLGILEDVVAGDPLVQVDRAVYGLLQDMRTGWADSVMVAVTALGGAAVTIPVVVVVSGLLAFTRRWRTLGHWLAAAGFAELLVWAVKYTVGRPRPTALYSGVEQFSFPSGHAAMSITVYGFLAFLLARGKSPGAKAVIVMCAATAIVLIAFSRLYLGVHWFSDVMASLSLGLAWVALLGIAYIHHVRDEHVGASGLLVAVSATLALAGGAVVRMYHEADVARYAYRPSFETVQIGEWTAQGWRKLPAARSELAGEMEEPFSIQWAATAEQISAALAPAGWRPPQPWASKAALLWLLPTATAGELPVLPKLDRGERQKLTFVKALNARERAVVRLWRSHVLVGGADGAPRPLWYGMATLEKLRRPGGLITVAATQSDFGAAARMLEPDLRKPLVATEQRMRDGTPVVLIR